MYGTVARMQVKPGQASALLELSGRWADEGSVPGILSEYVFRMDADPDVCYMCVVFESKESYFANAGSPAQDARYRQILSYLVGEPQWHDGEVVFAHTMQRASQGL